jgi:site-specific recombinase XerD
MVAPPKLRRLTVAEAVQRYFRDVERRLAAGSLAETTARTYRRDLDDFIRLAGAETLLDDLTGSDIDDIVVAFRYEPDRRYATPRPDSKGTGIAARFRQSISRLFTFAEREAFIQRNPMPDTSARPKARDRAAGARTALPLDSARALVEVPQAPPTSRVDHRLSVRDEVILRLLLETGPRVSELCAMDRSDIDVRDGVTWLQIRYGKGGKARDVPLSPSTAGLLTRYGADHRPPPWYADPPSRQEDSERALFVTFRGRRITPRDVQNLVARTCALLPAQVRRRATPHALRHTMATLALSSGAADVSVVQRLLGHASLATTGVYLDEIREELAQAVLRNPVTGRT